MTAAMRGQLLSSRLFMFFCGFIVCICAFCACVANCPISGLLYLVFFGLISLNRKVRPSHGCTTRV